MTKAAILVGALLLLAGVATASTLTGFVPASESPTLSVPTSSVEDDGRGAGEDISGPCDEAEHADDPRCAGVTDGRGATTTGRTTTTSTGEDISGPCDEAEHANDPRCTGVPGARRADDDRGHGRNRGRGSANSGPGSQNSGPGSVNSGRDHRDDDGSGRHGDDDDRDDDSGSGSGNSGSGGGDDD